MRKILPLAGLAAALSLSSAIAVGAAVETPQPSLRCKAGTSGKTIDVGIVRATACWTQTSQDGATLYTARFADQPSGDVDLNGFFVASAYAGDAALQVNDGTNRVTSVSLDGGPKVVPVQLRSLNVPVSGSKTDLGGSVKLDFTAPSFGSLVLDDLRLGSNSAWARALAGFLPGNAEVPITITEGGAGSMDLVIEATGPLALKGKPQSATIHVQTASGEGTELDGFEFSLNEISVGKFLTVNNLSAFYSAASNEFGGGAEASWPFPRPGGQAGFKVAFTMTNGTLRRLQVGQSGLVIPLGPNGIIKSLNGGFEVSPNGSDEGVSFNVGAGAGLGPPMWTPSGGVGDRPIAVNATLTAGRGKGGYFVKVNGDVAFMNIPLGGAYMGIYLDAGVDFGANVGIGLPSVRDNPNDPFYIGARVDGWIGGGKFQLNGTGRVNVFGWRLADGEILLNDQVVGACVGVLWVDVGGVYRWGGGLKLMGSSCGLGNYREQFPARASASAAEPRTVRLDRGEVILRAEGARGEAPRFKLVSPDGRAIAAPTGRDAVVREDNAFFVDERSGVTTVVPPRQPGRWKVVPLPGSAPVVSLKAGRRLAPERVRAKVRGRGIERTLVWGSAGGPGTTLSFSEEMPGGRDRHILTTDAASGRHRFTPGRHGNYGKRRLEVIVIHNGTPRRTGTLDTYRVGRPRLLDGPRKVTARRDLRRARVAWSPVRNAAGYLVTVTVDPANGRPVTLARHVGRKARAAWIRGVPGGKAATARVYALNADQEPGRPGRERFRLGPGGEGLKRAARQGMRSARATRRGIAVRTVCPEGGHCRVRLVLRLKGRAVGRLSYQQPPDTFHRVLLKPRDPRAKRMLRAGQIGGFRLELDQRRTSGSGSHAGGIG